MPRALTPQQRMTKYVQPGPDGCWEWTGSRDRHGYGVTRIDYQLLRAHRWSYEHHVGPIPEGLDLDHLCRNRACINPDHLEPVTRSVNLSRGATAMAAKERTHCEKGHDLTAPGATAVREGKRVRCLECERNRGRARRRKATA